MSKIPEPGAAGECRDGQPIATRLVQAGRRSEWTGPMVNPPVWRGSTMLYPDCAALDAGKRVNADGHFHYGRRGSPTQWALAEALTALEPEAAGTMLYPSGLAAIAGTLLALLGPGDHLLMVDSVYEPTRTLCDGLLARHGITTSYYDPVIGAGIADAIRPETRMIFLESPGSLTFEVQDVPAIVAAARARDVITAIDNTWATPLLLPALSLGVDVSIMACTKYVVGHSDVLMGSVTATARHWPAIRAAAQALGQTVSPDDAYLTLRGLRTLPMRLQRHQQSALTIARWLAGQPGVGRVLHPALPDFPGHALFARDFAGASGLFGFTLAPPHTDKANALVDALEHFGIGYSWGGYESLALPVDPQRIRTQTRWTDGPVIRLQVGLEEPADLIADLQQALARIA